MKLIFQKRKEINSSIQNVPDSPGIYPSDTPKVKVRSQNSIRDSANWKVRPTNEGGVMIISKNDRGQSIATVPGQKLPEEIRSDTLNSLVEMAAIEPYYEV